MKGFYTEAVQSDAVNGAAEYDFVFRFMALLTNESDCEAWVTDVDGFRWQFLFSFLSVFLSLQRFTSTEKNMTSFSCDNF